MSVNIASVSTTLLAISVAEKAALSAGYVENISGAAAKLTLLLELEEDLISVLDKVQGVPVVKVPLPTSKALLEESTAQ